MSEKTLPHQVFISHSSVDTWIARQIAAQIHLCGATTFLDEADIDHGDDFEDRIHEAANASHELLVLLTPWSIQRPYVWLELGLFWGAKKRIVGILHGLTVKKITSDNNLPLILKRTALEDINNIDSYFAQLRDRIKKARYADGT